MEEDEQPMAWAEFIVEFDHRPHGGVTIAYLPGMRASLPGAAVDAAVELGLAMAIDTPSREEAERYKADPYWRPGVASEQDEP